MKPDLDTNKQSHQPIGNCVDHGTLNNLLTTLIDLFRVDADLRYVDRPHLFDGPSRRTSLAEFRHVGTPKVVLAGLMVLANAELIDVWIDPKHPDPFRLVLRYDKIMETIKQLQEEKL